MISLKHIFLLCFLSITIEAYANTQDSIPDEQAIKKAAENIEWLNLLHYRERSFSFSSKMRTIADDKAFFLADDGDKNADSEMLKTLEEMQNTSDFASLPTTDEKLNNHPQCKFPARFDWLKKRFPNWASQLVSLPCPAYDAWIKEMNPKSVTLIFPAAYINSPSSMFGHTLFRIDSKSEAESSDLFAHSISYAADMPKDVGAWDYVYGGFFGGHPGYMYEASYYDKIIEYSDMDNRDIWEYPIDLNEQELTRMLKHTWELQKVRFDYYFLDENCALRLLDILDIARPGLESGKDFTTHAIPADTVRALAEKGILKEGVYRPSRITTLKAEIQQLSSKERDLIQLLASDMELSREEISAKLQPLGNKAKQAKVLDIAYQYLRYRTDKGQINPKKASKRSLTLLSIRSKLPKSAETIISAPLPSEKGHRTARFALGGGVFAEQHFVDLKVRPAFHDLLDNDAGYVAGAQINFLAIEARHYTELNKTTLEAFRLIDIKAHSARDRFFKPFSWEAGIGWKRNELNITDKTRFGLDIGGGLTQLLTDDIRITGLAKADINGNAYLGGQWDTGAGAELSLLSSLPQHSSYLQSKLRLSASAWKYQDENVLDGYRFSAALNIPIININNALRLTWKQQIHTSIKDEPTTEEALLSWHYYF